MAASRKYELIKVCPKAMVVCNWEMKMNFTKVFNNDGRLRHWSRRGYGSRCDTAWHATLTYNGAEMAGTADGVIPAFTGGITTPPAGYKKGGDHIDPYGDDAPLYTVTAENAAQYQERLSPGQLALLARHPRNLPHGCVSDAGALVRCLILCRPRRAKMWPAPS
jgi:hypothetical protein